MGYTHYFGRKQWTEEDKEGFKKALPLIQDVLKRHEDIIQFECDQPEPPQATDGMIHFNGIGENGHETFAITNSASGFDFCKTARKPYDLPVCEVLLILAAHCPNFEPSSDGMCGRIGEDEVDGMWQTAMDNVKELYGLSFKVEITKERDPYYDWRASFDGFLSAVNAGMKGEN